MVLCAALKIVDDKEPCGYIILPCYRHGDGFYLYRQLTGKSLAAGSFTEGFIKTDGTFLDRKNAFDHAYDCGQLSQAEKWYKQDHGENELYSEDLY